LREIKRAKEKVVKISLLVISLMISIAVSMLAVTAKKKGWGFKQVLIDELMPGFTWTDRAAIFQL